MKYMIDNARVLLAQFAGSDWRELHVRTPDGEIFIARDGGGPNPMLAAVAAPPVVDEASLLTVAAPHVANVAWLLPVGSTAGAGAVVARLELLGEPVEVTTAEAGTVARWLAAVGDCVEFDAPLLALARAS